jgi:hypothetical protein
MAGSVVRIRQTDEQAGIRPISPSLTESSFWATQCHSQAAPLCKRCDTRRIEGQGRGTYQCPFVSGRCNRSFCLGYGLAVQPFS